MSDTDWRPAPPPAAATPEAPASIRESTGPAPVAAEAKLPEVGIFKGLPVRSGGDKVWLLKDGKRRWVTTAEVYSKLGFKFGDEKELDFETLMQLPEGEPIT